MRRGRHVGHVELGYLLDVAEDLAQLAGHARHLVRREVQPRELGHMAYVVFADHGSILPTPSRDRVDELVSVYATMCAEEGRR